MRPPPDGLHAGHFLRWAGGADAAGAVGMWVLVRLLCGQSAGESVGGWLASHRLRYATFFGGNGRHTVKYFNPWLARLVRVYDGRGCRAPGADLRRCMQELERQKGILHGLVLTSSASPAAPCPGSPAGRTCRTSSPAS